MLDTLLGDLKKRIGRPHEASTSMPPDVYTREDFHALEIETIFHTGWHCIGRADELAEAGQYIAFRIADEPIFAIRGADGELRAFTNVCRHRLAELLKGTGTAGRIVCPYHAWVYDHEGRLVSAKYMPDDFDPSTCRLREHHVATWGGWVYVSLADTPSPLEDALAPLTQEMAGYEAENYELLFVEEEVWDTNWKCMMENFSEAYHVFCLHTRTIEPFTPHDRIRYEPGGAGFFRFTQETAADTAGTIYQGAGFGGRSLSERQKVEIPIICVMPTHLLSLSPHRTFWLCVQPDGVSKTRLRWGISAYPGTVPDDEREAYIETMKTTHAEINREDRAVVESIYRGARSQFAESGRLATMELSTWEFQQYIAKKVTGRN